MSTTDAPPNPWFSWDYVARNSEDIQRALGQHVSLTVQAVLLALVVALPLAFVAHLRPRLAGPVVGTAGVLAGIAFWGYGVYDERQRELVAITVEPAAEAASRTSPGIACGEGELLVSITNGSGKTVTGVRFNVGAYREGRSTNIAKGNWFDDDHIINPRGTVSACWKAPGLTRDPEGDRVVWKASIIKLEFAE